MEKIKIKLLHNKSLEILLKAEMDATIKTLENKKLQSDFLK